jgi:hypothetical protein
MGPTELELYTNLLNDYYGEDYIKSLEQMIEMLNLEFDIKISLHELESLREQLPEMKDKIINLKSCGIFY